MVSYDLTNQILETKACETNSGDMVAFSQACQEFKQTMQQAEAKISTQDDEGR